MGQKRLPYAEGIGKRGRRIGPNVRTIPIALMGRASTSIACQTMSPNVRKIPIVLRLSASLSTAPKSAKSTSTSPHLARTPPITRYKNWSAKISMFRAMRRSESCKRAITHPLIISHGRPKNRRCPLNRRYLCGGKSPPTPRWLRDEPKARTQPYASTPTAG